MPWLPVITPGDLCETSVPDSAPRLGQAEEELGSQLFLQQLSVAKRMILAC